MSLGNNIDLFLDKINNRSNRRSRSRRKRRILDEERRGQPLRTPFIDQPRVRNVDERRRRERERQRRRDERRRRRSDRF